MSEEKVSSTSIVPIEEKYLPVLIKIKEMEETKRDLEDKLKEIKKEIEVAMSEYNVTSVKTSFMNIIKTKDSESKSIDLKKLKEVEPDEYDKLLTKYPKITKRSGSVQFKLS